MLLASADTQQGRLNVATTVKENSYTSRKPDAQLLPKYKNDKTQFPTSPKGKVPNITARYDEYIRASIAMYEELRKRYGAEALMHFGTGKVLDLKGQYGLPKAGQYAVVHGRVVTDAWIANAQYGEVVDYIQEYHPHDINDAPYRVLNLPKGTEYITRPATTVITRTEAGRDLGSWAASQGYSWKTRNAWDQDEDQAAIRWGINLRRNRNK
jgi:hypothetical protein